MSLKETFRNVVIGELRDMDLSLLPVYASVNREELSYLRQKGVLDDDSIEQALGILAINHARKVYRNIKKTGAYPDHVGMPECLVYAIRQGVFSKKELAKLRFDHGETLETFCQSYGRENFLAMLRDELFNPVAWPAGYDDEHPSCC